MRALQPNPATAIDVADTWKHKGTEVVLVRGGRDDILAEHADEIKALVDRHLCREGAILFRGFRKVDVPGFNAFARSFGNELASYEFASTPRSKIDTGVYSSTEYPAHQWIPQHNEQAYTLRWPLKIWFYCDIPAEEGGATPLMDSREVYRRLRPELRRTFADKGLMYVRNYGNGLDLPWQQVFQTEDRSVVEKFCRQQDIRWEWLPDGQLRTRQVCQAVAKHPVTGEDLWFNQAHLFHVSGLEPSVRESLLDVVDEQDLPRNVYFGDGSRIDDALLDEVRDVYLDGLFSFPWEEGDVLMLDNMLVTHGRAPFKGKRRVLVAMAETYPN
ncbi:MULTISPECIES: TauD/TfdA family dioxygenase [unclassified Sinorhizobium]|uniref:TauD/TfdA family dioxygenase n=1 Tax=unclassified Sinorhizobium TaxID=2613772 RepID=UPI0035239157